MIKLSPAYKAILSLFGRLMVLMLAIVTAGGLVTGYLTSNPGALLSSIFFTSAFVIGTTTWNCTASDFGGYLLSAPVSRREFLRSIAAVAALYLVLSIALGMGSAACMAHSTGKDMTDIEGTAWVLAQMFGLVMAAYSAVIYSVVRYEGADMIAFGILAVILMLAFAMTVIMAARSLTGSETIGYLSASLMLSAVAYAIYQASQKAYRAKDF